MTDSNRYGDQPLGRSVEDIERESGNLVNSPVEGEVRRQQDNGAVVPAIVNSNTTGVPGAVINPDALPGQPTTPDDGTARPSRDSSEP